MLPKAERLKERKLFNITFSVAKKNRQKLSSGYLLLYYLFGKNNINKFPLTAFIVGTKVDKKATVRNLVKRRMKASYNELKKTFFISKDHNPIKVLIWVANESIKNATFKQIKLTMESILKRLEGECKKLNG